MRSLVLALFVALAASCGSRAAVQCKIDPDCNQPGMTGGSCDVNSATGNSWCSYDDPACPGGRRWAMVDTGDGLAGQCVVGPDAGVDAPPSNSKKLTVTVGGNGTGMVTSDPAGISCTAGACSATFPASTSVKLTGAATGSSVFLGWSDPCNGSGSCTVTVNSDVSLSALFGKPGSLVWLNQLSSSLADNVVAARAIGSDVVVVGTFGTAAGTAVLTVGTTTTKLTSAGNADIFAIRLNGATGAVMWAKRFGAAGNDVAMSLAVDSAGDVIIGGYFSQSVSFGGKTFVSAGGWDGFVAKLSGVDGGHVWSTAIGGTGLEEVTAVAADASNDVAVAGQFNNSTTLGGGTFNTIGADDIFIGKLGGSNGAHLWSKAFGSTASDHVASIDIDHSATPNNVVACGDFGAGISFGGPTINVVGLSDMYILKLGGAAGAPLASRGMGSTSSDYAKAVVATTTGEMIVAGTFGGSMDPGDGTALIPSSAPDIFVGRYGTTASHVWSKRFSGTGADDAFAEVLDASGNLFVSTAFDGSIAFGGPPLSSAGQRDIAVAELSSSDGSYLGSTRMGGASVENGYALAVLPSGTIVVGGTFASFSEFGGMALTDAGGGDGFVVVLMPLL